MSFSGKAQDDMLEEQTLTMCGVVRSNGEHDGIICPDPCLVFPGVKQISRRPIVSESSERGG